MELQGTLIACVLLTRLRQSRGDLALHQRERHGAIGPQLVQLVSGGIWGRGCNRSIDRH